MARFAIAVWRPILRLLMIAALCQPALAAAPNAKQKQKWVATWAASVQGPYPVGNAALQPELGFAIPVAEAGARDQSFRLMVKPDLWGKSVRLRFANTFGTRPVRFDGVYVGLQATGGTIVPGSNRPVTFAGSGSAVIQPGDSLYSDGVSLPFVTDTASPLLAGRRLAVSFHIVGSGGPMTWHAKALTTSYVSAPGAGARGADLGDDAYPFTTTSWFYLEAVDVMAPADTRVVAAFGDSLTEGTGSTLNGDDRWTDVLSRRLHAVYGTHISVVNAGIGGNQVMGPGAYSPDQPYAGGPSALQRVDRDVFSLSGIATILWLEGINDFGAAGTSASAVMLGMQAMVERVKARGGVSLLMGTLPTSLNCAAGDGVYGSIMVDTRRRSVNNFIRNSGVFDGVVDFDAVTLDEASGALLPEYQPNSTTGGKGDLLHPNRAGYQAMGNAIDLSLFQPGGPVRPAKQKAARREGDILAQR